MRRLLAVVVLLLPALALAQGASIPRDQGVLVVPAAPVGSCTAAMQIRKVASTGAEYWCNGGTWALLASSVASGSSGAVQSSNGSGGLTDSGVTATAGAVTAKSLRADGSVHAYDTSGDGTADTLPARVDAIAAARAHAAMYSADPEAYLKGGVFDGWLELARNYGPINLSQTSAITGQLQQCWNNSCASIWGLLCLNGSSAFAVGDTFVTGPNDGSTAGRTRTHVVTAITNGTGGAFPTATGCPNGTNNQITVAPSVGTDESVTGTSNLTGLWLNPSHFSNAGYVALGRAVGKASRTRDGVHGPNLLVNGNATYVTSTFPDGWEYTGSPTVASNNWFPAGQSSLGNFHCTEGSGNNACFYFTGGSASDVLRNPGQPAWIAVQPGARYAFSCAFTGAVANDTIALESDITNDGTLDEIVPVSLTSTTAALGPASWPAWVYATFDVPDQTSRVRLRIRRAGTTTLQVDGCSFRKASGLLAADSINSPANYLINDPGSRNIVLLSDSWGVSGTTGTAFAVGLAAELQSRLGRDVSSQIKVNGKSGITTNGMLTENTCTATSHLGGSLNCWQDAVEQYDPLYVIVVLGTNDVYGSVTATQYVTNILQIRARIMSMGAIPIIVSAFPVGDTTGVGSKYDLAHQYRDAVRAAILGDVEGFQTSTFRTAPTASASAAYNPMMPAASGTVVLSDVSGGSTFQAADALTLNADSNADGTGEIDLWWKGEKRKAISRFRSNSSWLTGSATLTEGIEDLTYDASYTSYAPAIGATWKFHAFSGADPASPFINGFQYGYNTGADSAALAPLYDSAGGSPGAGYLDHGMGLGTAASPWGTVGLIGCHDATCTNASGPIYWFNRLSGNVDVCLAPKIGAPNTLMFKVTGGSASSPAAGEWCQAKYGLDFNCDGTADLQSAPASQYSSVTVANTVAETTLIGTLNGSATIPANVLQAGTTLRVTALGYQSNTASPTLRIKTKLGGTTFCDSTALTVNNAGSNTWKSECYITTRAAPGASVATIGQGVVEIFTGSTTSVKGQTAVSSTTNLATNGTLAVDVTAQWGSASASNTITLTNLTIERVK